jgi:hypothetical protein
MTSKGLKCTFTFLARWANLASQLEADEKMLMPSDRGGCDVLWASEWVIYSLVRNISDLTSQQLKKWLKEEAAPSRRHISGSPTITAIEALALVIPIFQDLGVGRERLNIWLLIQYRRIYPDHSEIFVDIRSSAELNPEPDLSPAELKPELNLSPNAVPDSASRSKSEVESEIYWRSPTEVGKLIKTRYNLGFTPSPQAVNGALVALELQARISWGDKKKWIVTKSGQSYGRMTTCLDPLGKKRPQIRWSTEVVPMVAQHLGLS